VLLLRSLGELDLRGSSGQSLGSIVAQPKRVALLAWLAIASPRGFHRRDTLLGLFWPEATEPRARAALSQAIYVLRRGLGDDVLIARGDDELGLAPGRLRCDVAEFEQAHDAGHLQTALELYRGELLPGFFLDGCPEFERWLDGERRRLKERARSCAVALADAHAAQGNLIDAITAARRAVAIESYDEDVLRRLLRLLDLAADRAGAASAYEAFASRLMTDLELEPSPETRALAASIIESPTERLATVPTSAAAAIAAGFEHDPSSRRRIVRRYRGGVVAATFIAVVLATWGVVSRQALSARSADASNLAVLPFHVRGDRETAWLAEGVAELLATRLEDVADVRPVNIDALLSTMTAPADRIDLREAAELAAQFGARDFVLGSVVQLGDQLHLRATVYRAADRSVRAGAAVDGDAERLLELVDELAVKLLSALPDVHLPGTSLSARTTTSLPALKAYLTGESAYRAGRFGEAVFELQRAVDADSTFALAHYRLALAALWAERDDVSFDDAAALALRYADRLSSHDRALLHGFLAWRRGDSGAAERIYRAAVGDDRDDIEAWHQLGETLFHYNPSRGRPIAEAKWPFEEVLRRDPRNWGALWHLLELAAADRRWDDLRSLAAQARSLEPEPGRLLEVDLLEAIALGDSAAERRLHDQLRALPEDRLDAIVWRVAVLLRDPAAAVRIAALLTDPERTADGRTMGLSYIATLELARGRRRAADHILDLGSTVRPTPAYVRLTSGALTATLPLLELPADSARALAAALEVEAAALATTARVAANTAWFQQEALLAGVGRLHGLLGNADAAEHAASRLAALPDVNGQGISLTLAQGVRATAFRTAGRTADALRALEESSDPHVWFGFAVSSPLFSLGFERFLRAELLHELGRSSEALPWYESLTEYSLYDLVYLAPSHLRRAQIHDRSGHLQRATLHYSEFIRLWRDCDPELQPLVDAARARLRALAVD
jgi:serine/threonine-protein kinase